MLVRGLFVTISICCSQLIFCSGSKRSHTYYFGDFFYSEIVTGDFLDKLRSFKCLLICIFQILLNSRCCYVKRECEEKDVAVIHTKILVVIGG